MESKIFGTIPFIPGATNLSVGLLSRHLPPIPNGIISKWLNLNVPPSSWMLDPFGASPQTAVEAARAGYRVIVTANNPIVRFLLEISANPPRTEDLQSALAELSASYIGDERIEPHIRDLYNTYCSRCGQIVSATAFLWQHGDQVPYSRIYTCPSCGDSGEHPCTSYDLTRASQISGSRLHKARALERVVASTDPDRIHVEQALSVYIPRALYGLITIINKLQGLNLSPEALKNLAALLLYSFDQTNAMWRVDSLGDRRRSLTIPRRFREYNIWCALEDSIDIISQQNYQLESTITPVTIWPELPPSTGGICIYEGRFINLISSLENIEIKSVCCAIPRPNQAFWTLSALWAGWLWGREAVGSFKSVLHRQRYDWAWHTTALSSVFKPLANYLDSATPIFGVMGEAEPGFIGSALLAANIAGCQLESIAVRPEDDQAQIIWRNQKAASYSQISSPVGDIANQFAKQYISTISEPVSYLNCMSAAFWAVIKLKEENSYFRIENAEKSDAIPKTSNEVNEQSEQSPSVIYSNTYNAIREILTYQSGFLQYNIQDVTNIEASMKDSTFQSSLFPLEDENAEAVISDEGEQMTGAEPISEKERPTRSSDISKSALLWLRETSDINHKSLSDFYEEYFINNLFTNPGSTILEIDAALCQAFPGLLTPGSQFIRLCLESYGQPDPTENQHWYLRSEDEPEERQADVQRAHEYLYQIGSQLEFECEDRESHIGIPYTCWIDRNDKSEYWFFTIVTSAIGEIALFGDRPAMRGYIVFPGSRANLLLYKLRRDLRLNRAFSLTQGIWRFLKFRHLKSLSETPLLNRDNLEQFLNLDPLTYSTPQLWLI